MIEYKILITQRAFSDISECVLFVNNVSNESAKELYAEIISSINSLKTLPNIYPNIEGLTIRGINVKRMPIHHGRYFILYKVENNIVNIYDVIDTRKENAILKL
jgi:hypothetical protein